jgi:hypothetical protein
VLFGLLWQYRFSLAVGRSQQDDREEQLFHLAY